MKTKIVYDLNIFQKEVYDSKLDKYVWTDDWFLDIYTYKHGSIYHWDGPFTLSDEDVKSIGLNEDPYFSGGDSWIGLDGFLDNYKVSNSLMILFSKLPEFESID